jgi:hypothetical protein
MLRTADIPLHYVECDIPDGVTLTQWRRDKVAAERRSREEARASRPRRRLLPRLGARPALRPRFA